MCVCCSGGERCLQLALRSRQAKADDGASQASSSAEVLAGLRGSQALLPGGGSLGHDSSSDGDLIPSHLGLICEACP